MGQQNSAEENSNNSPSSENTNNNNQTAAQKKKELAEKRRNEIEMRMAQTQNKTAKELFPNSNFFFTEGPRVQDDEALIRDCSALKNPPDGCISSIFGYYERLLIIKLPSDSNPEHNHFIFYNNSPSLRFNIIYHFPPRHGTIKASGSVDINNAIKGWTTLSMVLDPNETARFVGSPRDCSALDLMHDFRALPLPESYNRRAALKTDDEIKRRFAPNSTFGSVLAKMEVPIKFAAPFDRQSQYTSEFLRWCVANKCRFIDPIFRPNSAALGSASNLPWRPAADSNTGSKITVAAIKKIRPELISPGDLGDSWVCSAISSISMAPHRVLSMFVGTKDEVDVGAYVIRMNKDGWWRFVVVDDYLPCTGYRLAFMTTVVEKCGQPTDIYPGLLQKAFARLHGSYTNISAVAGDHLEAQMDLTGYPIFNFDEDWKYIRKDQCNTRRIRMQKRKRARIENDVCVLPDKKERERLKALEKERQKNPEAARANELENISFVGFTSPNIQMDAAALSKPGAQPEAATDSSSSPAAIATAAVQAQQQREDVDFLTLDGFRQRRNTVTAGEDTVDENSKKENEFSSSNNINQNVEDEEEEELDAVEAAKRARQRVAASKKKAQEAKEQKLKEEEEQRKKQAELDKIAEEKRIKREQCDFDVVDDDEEKDLVTEELKKQREQEEADKKKKAKEAEDAKKKKEEEEKAQRQKEPEEALNERIRQEGDAAADRLFTRIERHVEVENHIVSLCTPNADSRDVRILYRVADSVTLERLFTEMGLTMGRAYFVIKVVHDRANDIKLLQFKEPWTVTEGKDNNRNMNENHLEWRGMWGNESYIWRSYPALAQVCGMEHLLPHNNNNHFGNAARRNSSSHHHYNAKELTHTVYSRRRNANGQQIIEQGTFWMEWSDALRYFDSGGVCYASRTDPLKEQPLTAQHAHQKYLHHKNLLLLATGSKNSALNPSSIPKPLPTCSFDYRIRGDFFGLAPNVIFEIQNHSNEPIRILFILSQVDRRGLPKDDPLKDRPYAGLNLSVGWLGKKQLKKRSPAEIEQLLLEKEQQLLAQQGLGGGTQKDSNSSSQQQDSSSASSTINKLSSAEADKTKQEEIKNQVRNFFSVNNRKKSAEQKKREQLLQWTNGQVCQVSGSSGLSVDEGFVFGEFKFVHRRDVSAEWSLPPKEKDEENVKTHVILPRVAFLDSTLDAMDALSPMSPPPGGKGDNNQNPNLELSSQASFESSSAQFGAGANSSDRFNKIASRKFQTPYVVGIISSVPIGKDTFSVKFKKPDEKSKLFTENLPQFWYNATDVKDVPYQVPYQVGSVPKNGYEPSIWRTGSEIDGDGDDDNFY